MYQIERETDVTSGYFDLAVILLDGSGHFFKN